MKFIDRLLDKTIYFSFDRTGYKRHAKEFKDEIYCAKGKTAIVTGANAGIGLAVTRAFCQQGLRVSMLCRSEEKAETAKKQLLREFPDAQLDIFCVDVSEQKSVKAFLQRSDIGRVDIVVNNAGGMPETLTLNSEGNEIVWASHVVGHFLLVEGLIEREKLGPGARVITVSSGGMYSQKLDLSDINFEKTEYNKYIAYANAKRAQVILNELWQQKHDGDVVFSCMHPGWANTGGVRKAMPRFYSWMKNRLRTVEEGADTIVWLALTSVCYPSGRFWFDRKEAPVHLMKKTHESHDRRVELWKLLQKEK